MPTISKSLSSKIDGDGKSEILLRFSGGRGKVFRVKSGIRIAPNRWNASEGRIIIPRLETPEQRQLVKSSRELDDVCNLLIAKFTESAKVDISSQWFAQVLDEYRHPERASNKDGDDFFTIYEKFLDDHDYSKPRDNHFNVLQRLSLIHI